MNNSSRLLVLSVIAIFILFFSAAALSSNLALDLSEISQKTEETEETNLRSEPEPETGERPDPEAPVTRKEFSLELAEILGLEPESSESEDGKLPFPDVADPLDRGLLAALEEAGIVSGHSDGTFRPDRILSRGELAQFTVRALDPPGVSRLPKNTDTFTDIPADHWAHGEIFVAHSLELLDGDEEGRFHPEQAVTRAEADAVLEKFKEYRTVSGVLIDNTENILTVRTTAETETITYEPEITVIRNSILAAPEQLKEQDQLNIIYGPGGSLKYIHAYGEMTERDIQGHLRDLFGEALTPEMVTALLTQDWDAVRAGAEPQIREQLGNLGLTPDESDALLEQDWEAMDEIGRENLTQAAALEYGIQPGLIAAILDRDWEKVQVWLQIEAINRDVIGQASELTDGWLGPGEIVALFSGEWGMVSDGVQEKVMAELEGSGLTKTQTELLLNRNWEGLRHHEEEQLKLELAQALGVEKEAVEALFQRDWPVITEMAQGELIQLLVETLFEEGDAAPEATL